jgi:peroxiredoxin Q/BCP
MKTLSTLSIALAAVILATAAGAASMLKPGDPFPAWHLVDQKGAPVSSADLAGHTYLMWFFPKALSSGCTAEGCALRDNFSAFEKAKVEVVGVSFDPPKDNAKFVAKEHFPFRLLSDSDRKLAVEVGAADCPSRMYARRISYLVGPDGRVLKAYDNVDPRTHAKQVLADLNASR